MKTTAPPPTPPLHSVIPSQRRHFNRLFAGVYAAALLFLFYHHILSLLHSATITSLLLFISDVILAYMWSTCQAFRMNPVHRQSFPENLQKILDPRDFPAMDIFICTADPYKEPPIDVVNTALSVMAYDYPAEKLSVYVSDDGGSELTMFAFMEAAKFGKLWLPFCRENNIADRCPDAYFSTNYALSAKTLEIKMMYESMKIKIENIIERGKISDEYISSEEERKVLNQYWSKDFSHQNHPTVIQVLLNTKKDVDSTGGPMPNLIYVSREKRKTAPHHFKAGALNALLRVSATMTNSPIVLTLDCDMYSNDPLTAQRVLCYLPNRSNRPNCGYIQFPQCYHGLNEADIYASEHKRVFRVNPLGMDGLNGPNYVGTGCFFLRRVFFGGPSLYVRPEILELGPDHVVDKPIEDQEVLGLAHRVARCNYEDLTDWGSKMGFRYGSLVEDYYTGYHLICEGWQAIFCDPIRPAFLGGVPISLNDALGQIKRWSVGLLEVGFSKYSPMTFGIRAMGPLMGLCYVHYAFWAILSIPITIYAFVPSLALLRGIPIFPKVYDPLFLVYTFLFLGAYGEDCLDFISTQGTFQRWWSDQRMWLMWSLSASLFGSIEYTTKRLGMATHGFNVTSKVVDDEQSKRYDQGIFEFGVPSPLFVPLAMAAILNLIAFFSGFVYVMKERCIDSLFMQMFIAGFGVMNGLPFYEAMVLRRDKGRLPTKTTITSTLLLGVLYGISYFVLRN
ncbi:Cellulose synthase (UDP-forming) [Handroanthus impetiginosus]|uniref:Cellulose synthase (UDP-forming) n=1 Tax=Handroanthus impetiginosus TaxID=429701 RepID=A0A2G9GLD3_9LAMI|nr:Cellulose synthase (UDP-forming) [Handroanthus impetiginosus]